VHDSRASIGLAKTGNRLFLQRTLWDRLSLCVVADRRLAKEIRGIGPIIIDLRAQNLGAGHKLMQAAMDRANQCGAAGIRLVQAAFHNRSLSLYASLGFNVREPLSCMQGCALEKSIPGCEVRPAK
jgi:GNAT superfamily N-acetyltransferase